MLRNVLLVLTALLLALTPPRAFWVWLGENPFNISGQGIMCGWSRCLLRYA